MEITKKSKGSMPSGIKTPSQMKTISGPGVRVNNQYNSKKQSSLPIVGKNKGK